MFTEVSNFNHWLRRRSPHTSTHIHYTSDVRLFFAWAKKAPAAITARDVDAYIEHCRQQRYAIATINRRLASLSAFYRFLNLTVDNPSSNPVLPRQHFIRQGCRLPRDADDEALERLFAVITSSRDKAIFLLMLRCGLRVGEVQKLSLPDLYLQPSPGSRPRLWIRGKGGVQRVVYPSSQVLAALREWLLVRPNCQKTAIFLNRFGRRLSVSGIQDRLDGYCRQAGVRLTCHQLRHSFGRHLVEAGVPVTTIQRLLGHKQLRTTQLYLHLSDRQAQADYEAAITQASFGPGMTQKKHASKHETTPFSLQERPPRRPGHQTLWRLAACQSRVLRQLSTVAQRRRLQPQHSEAVLCWRASGFRVAGLPLRAN